MRRMREALTSRHVQAVTRLSSGVGLAQLIALLSGPLVTRLYDPSEYGTMALYVAVVAIVSTVATGRYDAAVSLPAETASGERAALGLVRIAMLLGALTALGVGVVVCILAAVGAGAIFGDLGLWALALPIGVLSSALQQALMAYATRQRAYGQVAKVAPLQRAGAAAMQIGFGLAGAGRSGLMVAALVSPIIGLGLLGKVLKSGRQLEHQRGGRTLQPRELRELAGRYSDFPRLNLPFALMNALSWNVQILVIAWFYTGSDIGQYSLAFMVVSLPASLLASAVSQVYLRESAGKVDDPIGNLSFTKRLLKGLALASLVPFPLIMLIGPQLFGLLFGEAWQLAGEIAVAISPLLWCRFLGTTISSAFTVYRRNGLLMAWQAVALGLTLACFVLGGAVGLSIVDVAWLSSAVVGPWYLVLIPLGLRVIARSSTSQRSAAAPEE